MKVFALPAFALLLLGYSLTPLSVISRETASVTQSQATALRVSSNLVLVPVVATDPKTGLPDKTLNSDDFRVFDNGQPVSIQTFDTGASARPLALWFIVQCRMPGYDPHGSGFFRGQILRLKSALRDLPNQDDLAVAHWCDDGTSNLDLLPTKNQDAALSTLEQVLAPPVDASDHERTGELALQKTLQLIVDFTRSRTPEPVPVLIFLYGDHSGMPKSEADHFIDQLLETSAIAFGLRDNRSPRVGQLQSLLWHEQAAVAHYIAAETGGQYLDVTPETYSTGLEDILKQLHFRYELGFRPEALDGKRHKLTVQLATPAKRQHKGVRLRYRAAYVPVLPGAS